MGPNHEYDRVIPGQWARCLGGAHRSRLAAGAVRLLAVAALAAALALTVSACAGRTGPLPTQASPVIPSPWPSVGDYTTIRTARQVMLDALLREGDWRRKSFGASLAMQTLVAVRLAPGPCATYVGHLYSELYSLMDGYQGEDWSPLVRLVRHDQTVQHACQRSSPAQFQATA